MTRFAILAASCLALAACGETSDPSAQAEEDATARGEVLGGTISDDMLPLDTVTSQSPPRGGESGDVDNADGDSAPEPASEPAPQAATAPAPALEPASAEEAEPEE